MLHFCSLDSYKGHFAPLLIAHTPTLSHANTATPPSSHPTLARARSSLTAVLQHVGFQSFPPDQQQALGNCLGAVGAAKSLEQLRDAVATVESVLTSAGCMDPAWEAAWAERWRKSLADLVDVKMASLHAQTLQQFVVENREVLLSPFAAA